MNKKRIKVRKWVKIFFVIILFITLTYLYGRYIEIKNFKTNEISIVDSKLPSNFYGLKIVQISDIHYKVTTTKEDLENLVNEVNLLKPDIVILTGDLFDKNIKYTEKDFNNIKKILNSIEYNISKYAIKGEDDLKIKNWENIMNESNFSNLNDNYELIYNEGIEPILLIGISSNYRNKHIKETLNSIHKEISVDYKYSILALHEPDIIDSIDYNKFNLILAGHSHNGQIYLPYIGGLIKDKYAKKYSDNFYDLGNTKMYISSGIGTTKYKFRLFNKPSINFYRLRNK